MRKKITFLMLLCVFGANALQKDTTHSIKKRNLLKELLEADLSTPSKASEGVKSITGHTFSRSSSASIPEKYFEVAIENNWNPNAMTNEEMENEYNRIMRFKYLRWFYISIGIISLVSSLVFIRNVISKTIIMKMHFVNKFKDLSKGTLRKNIVISCLICVLNFALFYIFKSINGDGNMHSKTYYYLSELFFFLFFFGFPVFWGMVRIVLWIKDGEKEDVNKSID